MTDTVVVPPLDKFEPIAADRRVPWLDFSGIVEAGWRRVIWKTGSNSVWAHGDFFAVAWVCADRCRNAVICHFPADNYSYDHLLHVLVEDLPRHPELAP